MGGVVRLLLQGSGDDFLDLVQQDRGRTPGPGLVEKSVEPPGDEPAPPSGHGRLADPQVGGLREWIKNWKDDPRPFAWTKTADEILTSLCKISSAH